MRFRVEILLFSLILHFQPLTAQIPTNVFEIESILVDACGGTVEGKNEMVLIMTGPNAVNFANVRVDGISGTGAFVNSRWPTTTNNFLGWATYNAALRAKLTYINNTITNCGVLLEPPSNIVPAGQKCLIITSHEFDETAHDFSTLSDTLYVICQNNTIATAGNFTNFGVAGLRQIRLMYTTTSQSDQVSYDKALLIDQMGVNAAQDGAGVRYTWAGAATYYNDACTAPYEPLVPDFTLPTSICPNSSALDLNTTITGTTGGTWSGTGVTGHMFDPTGLSGSISITYTVGIAPCDLSQTHNINVTSPTSDAGVDASITCTSNVGGVAIGSATVAGNTYAWSPSTGLSSSTVSNPTANPASTTTYTVTVTNTASGCTATDQITVSVSANMPTADAGADASITCTSNVGGVAIGSVTVAGNTYAWSPSTVLSSSTVSNPTANPGATTTYTVTVTNTASGCTATDQITVSVSANMPTADAGADASITCTSNVGGVAIGSATVAGNTYAWSPSTGLSSSTVSNPTANPGATTTYTVTVTNTASGCTATDQITVSVSANMPTADAGADASITCTSNVGGVAIGSATVAGNTYAWSPSTGLSSSTVSNPTAIPASTTTYTVTVTNTASGCTATDQVVISVDNTLPVANAGADQSVCIGGSVTLNGSGGTLTWSGGITNGLAFQPVVTQTYNLTVTNPLNGCTDQASVLVTVNPLPNVNINPSTTIICPPASATLNATGGAGTMPYVFDWSPASSLNDATNNPSPVASPTVLNSTVSYTVTITDANLCSNTASVDILVSCDMAVQLSANDAEICIGESVTITPQVSGGVPPYSNYQWSNGLSGTGAQVVSPIANTTYSLTVNDANGQTATHSVSVVVNPLPIVNTNNDTTICLGSSAPLTATGANVYQWNQGVGNGANHNVSPLMTTNYIVTGTDANGCVNTSDVTITVLPLPIVDAGVDVSVCQGDSVQISASGAMTYQWNNALGSGASKWVHPLVLTVYQVTGTDAMGCSNTDQITVSSLNKPLVDAVDNTTICNGENFTLTVNGASSYEWSNGLGAGQTHVVQPLLSTEYFVTGTDLNGCSNIDSVTVSVLMLGSVNMLNTDTIVCSGAVFQLNATGSTNYQWYSNHGTLLPNFNQAIYSPITTGWVYVQGTSSSTCPVIDSILVEVNHIDISLPLFAKQCIHSNLTITPVITGGIPPYQYQWSYQNLNTSSLDFVIDNHTPISLTVTDALNCSQSDQITYLVYDSLHLNVHASDYRICEDDTIQMAATIYGGTGTPYTLWMDQLPISNVIDVKVESTHDYIFKASDGCMSVFDTIRIEAIPTPNLDFLADRYVICENEEVKFTSIISQNDLISSYVWNFGTEDANNASVSAHPLHQFELDGKFDVTLSVVTIDGCQVSITKHRYITVNPLPEASFTVSPSVTTSIKPLFSFQNLSIGAVDYQWSIDDNEFSTETNPWLNYPNIGIFEVRLVASSPYACYDTAYQFIEIKPAVEIWFPTAFSPDGDRQNENFGLKGVNLVPHDFEMKIFDRWGEVIFETNNLNLNWDGKVKNNSFAKPGVYTYWVRVFDVYEQAHELSGNFNLIR